MSFDQAAAAVYRDFPFKGYLHEGFLHDQYPTVAARAARHVPPGGRILDFGCGPGDVAVLLAHLGYRVWAGDDLQDDWHHAPGVREQILTFVQKAGVHYSVLMNDTPLPWRAGEFDMVMLHHVLEHLDGSPRGLFLKLIELLRPGGFLFITVPSAVNLRKRIDVLRGRSNHPGYASFFWSQGYWRGHRREYVRSDLAQLAEFLGLRVLELTSYHYMIEKIPRRLRPIWRLATAAFPGWRDSWLMVAQRPQNWSAPKPPPPKPPS